MLTVTQREFIGKKILFEHLSELNLETELRRELQKRFGDYEEQYYREVSTFTRELIADFKSKINFSL